MCQIKTDKTYKTYTCLINRGINSNCNTVVTAILFKSAEATQPNIQAKNSKIRENWEINLSI